MGDIYYIYIYSMTYMSKKVYVSICMCISCVNIYMHINYIDLPQFRSIWEGFKSGVERGKCRPLLQLSRAIFFQVTK